MGSLKLYASVAGFLAVAASSMTARAADLLPPPPMPEPFEVTGGFAGSWYLRGDIGFTNQDVERLDSPGLVGGTSRQKGFDSAPFGGVGVGYKFNDWLRADITGEYRGRSNLHASDSYVGGTTFPAGVNEYSGSKSEWVGLANLYLDLGTWHGFTPFVGGGVGFANNRIHNFRDTNVPTGGVAFGRDHDETNLAWAVHAGVSYAVSPNMSVEFGYRYLNLGDARTGIIVPFDSTVAAVAPIRFRNIDSHDFKVGFRWTFADTPIYEHPPLIRKY